MAASDKQFNRIHQVVPMSPCMRARWLHLVNAIELVLPSAHPSPQPKQQIDRFTRFWATVCKRVRICYRTVVCLLVCMSVCLCVL